MNVREMVLAAALAVTPFAVSAQRGQTKALDCIQAQGVQSGDARLRNICKEELNVAWCVRGGGNSSQRCPTGGGGAALRQNQTTGAKWLGGGTLLWGACFAPHRPTRVTGADRYECRRS